MALGGRRPPNRPVRAAQAQRPITAPNHSASLLLCSAPIRPRGDFGSPNSARFAAFGYSIWLLEERSTGTGAGLPTRATVSVAPRRPRPLAAARILSGVGHCPATRASAHLWRNRAPSPPRPRDLHL